jgi:hypothetical protein
VIVRPGPPRHSERLIELSEGPTWGEKNTSEVHSFVDGYFHRQFVHEETGRKRKVTIQKMPTSNQYKLTVVQTMPENFSSTKSIIVPAFTWPSIIPNSDRRFQPLPDEILLEASQEMKPGNVYNNMVVYQNRSTKGMRMLALVSDLSTGIRTLTIRHPSSSGDAPPWTETVILPNIAVPPSVANRPTDQPAYQEHV